MHSLEIDNSEGKIMMLRKNTEQRVGRGQFSNQNIYIVKEENIIVKNIEKGYVFLCINIQSVSFFVETFII